MSTIYGNGQEIDLNLKCASSLATTTSQFKVAYMSDEFTAAIIASTATARQAIGIVQTAQSAGSSVVGVRVSGLSKGICGASITAGQWVCAYEGVSTTTHYGSIQGIPALGASMSVATASVTAYRNILGFALENGQTNQAISVVLMPQLYDANLLQ